MLLANRIKAIRTHKSLSQQILCERLDINQSTYSGYEREAGNLKFLTIVKIAQALECSIPFLTDIHSSLVDETEWNNKKHTEYNNINQ